MAFYFSGRNLAAGDRLKMPTVAVTPPGAGLIGLCRPAATQRMSFGFEAASAAGGWAIGRGSSPGNVDRLGLYRPLRAPTLMAGAAGPGSGTATTAAFTPPAYSTLIAFCSHRDTANPTASSCTTAGLTWTLVPGADIAVNDGTAFLRLRAFYAVIGASPASMTVATVSNLADQAGIAVVAIEGGGVDFSNIHVNSGAAGAVTATLPTAPTPASMIVGAFQDRNFASSITPPSGYSQIFFGNVGSNGKLQIVTEDNATAPAVAWNDPAGNLVLGMAIEMRQEPAAEHSSALWMDGRLQTFLAYSESTTSHWLALGNTSTLERSTATMPLDATNAVVAGRFDLAPARGGFDGDLYWLGVLKAMPPLQQLDQVLRQQEPPTILRPWLAHLIPLQGRNPERCGLTYAALNVDSGTTLANIGVPQPQEEADDSTLLASLGTSRRRIRVTARNATTDTVLTLDGGPSGQVAAIVVSLPVPGATTGLGVAVNGGALTTSTLPSVAPAQQGNLIVGTSILDGVTQTEAGSVRLGALAIGPLWTASVHSALWSIASSYLRPIANPITLVGEINTAYAEDLSTRIKDPARAGYTLSLSGVSVGLTASISGKILNYQTAAAGNYGATLTITSLLTGLVPSSVITVAFTMSAHVERYANGYQWRALLHLPAWPGGAVEPTHLVPVAELGQSFKSVANGGKVESAVGWDVRFELPDGTKIAHRLLTYDPVAGRLAALLNFPRDLTANESIYLFLGKTGLLQSEENTALTRSGGWLAWHSGADLQDLTNFGHTLTDSGTISQTSIGAWPAGQYNGSSSYRFRASNELNALSGFFVAVLVQSSEAVGRSQEFLNIAPGDIAQLAMRLTSQGYWTTTVDVGGQLLSVSSDTELYVPGEPHAFGVYWNSGQAPGALLDGRVVEPTTPPPVASGTTDMDETLELGRGNRPPGTASYWNGQIGPVLMAGPSTSQSQRAIITAALKEPRLVYALADFQAADDASGGLMALPLQGTAVRNAATAFNVAAIAYNPGGVPVTVAVPVPPTNVTCSVAGGSITVTPNNSAGNRVLLRYLLSSTTLSSTGVIDLTIGAASGGGGGGGTNTFPADYPTPPDFSTATVVTVSSEAALESALAGSIPAAGLVIQLSATTNDFGSVTINRAGAKIKIVGLAPRFDGLITQRDALRRDGLATIDQTNLRPQSATDSTIETHCIQGGLRPHTATNRINLTVTNCGVLWLEGLDFFNTPVTASSGGGTYRLQVQGGNGCDQLWLTKCSGDRTDGYIFSLGGGSEGSKTSDSRGASILVAWENYLFGEGTIRDPGSSGTVSGVGVLTDYGFRMYSCGQIYMWKNIFAGGYNHSLSTKQKNIGPMYVDDCIFASYHPITDSWAYIEVGQAADLSAWDRTSGMNWVRGCTLTGDVSAGASDGKMILAKNVTGVGVQNCTVYSGVGAFFIAAVGGTGGTGTFTDTGVVPGSDDVLVENCRFVNATNSALGQPPVASLGLMNGKGYTFTARNNAYSTQRAVSSKSGSVSTSYGSSPGFSG